MTSASDIPDWRERKISVLSVNSDLSPEAYRAARNQLRELGDPRPGCLLVASKEAMTKEFRAWLWDNFRTDSYQEIYTGFLRNPRLWWIEGVDWIVVSEPP